MREDEKGDGGEGRFMPDRERGKRRTESECGGRRGQGEDSF